MQLINQTTLSKPVTFEGIGLHSGKKSRIEIKPAEAGSGIVFKRIDLKQDNLVAANYKNVTSARLCTTLENRQGIKVSTVEHLLAALYLADIDNAIVEINNEEVPIMDGSAKDFLKILKNVELKQLLAKRKYLKVTDKIELVDGERKISIEPNDDSLIVDFKLKYENLIIGNQRNTVNFKEDNLNDVASSRTFCLFQDIEKIKKAGLAKGGSLDNAVVVDEEKVLNKEGLRNKKEFVNHKILDLVGDFVLSGYRIIGKVKCDQGGHELTNLFLRKALSKKSLLNVFELNSIFISKKSKSLSNLKIAVNA